MIFATPSPEPEPAPDPRADRKARRLAMLADLGMDLARDLGRDLGRRAAEEGFADASLPRQVARVCDDLGLKPVWSRWREGGDLVDIGLEERYAAAEGDEPDDEELDRPPYAARDG